MADLTGDQLEALLWRTGHPVMARDLGPWTKEASAELHQRVKSGTINARILTSLECPKCQTRLTLVRRFVLLCEKCKFVADTREDFRPEWYSLSVDLIRLQRASASLLAQAGFSQADAPNVVPALGGVGFVGLFRNSAGQELDLFMGQESVRQQTLLQIWGYANAKNRRLVLVHPGLTEGAAKLLELGAQICPVLSVQYSKRIDDAVLAQIRLFPSYCESVSRALDSISAGIEAEDSDVDKVGLFTGIDHSVEELARSGGVSYEPYALGLLMPLGPTFPFTKRGWVPDGVLLDPRGFWIVDPKSSEHGFTFSTAEEDKLARYLRVMRGGQESFGPSLRFRGEIIVTRTDPIPPERLSRATDFVRSQAPGCVVSLVSHEALSWLRDEVQKDLSYWHLRNPIEDGLNLLMLSPKAFENGHVPSTSLPFVDAPLKLIDRTAVECHLKLLKSRGLYHGMGRTPQSVSELVQGMYVREFAGLP